MMVVNARAEVDRLKALSDQRREDWDEALWAHGWRSSEQREAFRRYEVTWASYLAAIRAAPVLEVV